MMYYTVEVTTEPVQNDDWSALRHVLDVVPGSLLVEDPGEPLLIIPVQADGTMKAALFVDGLSKLLHLTLKSGRIYPTPEDDFELDDDEPEETEAPQTEVVRALDSYVAAAPEFDCRLTEDGRLVGC